jgi:hypothetical protein
MRILSEWFYNDNYIPYELQRKGDIECYDKFMEQYPNYPKIWWHNLILLFKQKAKEYFKS